MAQRILYDYGYHTCLPDGYFGTDTYNAVREYQTSNGLIIDGLIGSQTWSSLEAELITVESTSTYTTFFGGSSPPSTYDYTIEHMDNVSALVGKTSKWWYAGVNRILNAHK